MTVQKTKRGYKDSSFFTISHKEYKVLRVYSRTSQCLFLQKSWESLFYFSFLRSQIFIWPLSSNASAHRLPCWHRRLTFLSVCMHPEEVQDVNKSICLHTCEGGLGERKQILFERNVLNLVIPILHTPGTVGQYQKWSTGLEIDGSVTALRRLRLIVIIFR